MQKIKYTLEYSFNTSIKLLYNRISTPDGLAEWFADDVHLKGDNYIFIWDGDEQPARIIQKKDNSHIRFQWIDDEDDKAYFEFRIEVDELTEDVALVITDFAYEDEKDDNIDLWEAQVDDLHKIIG
ncbi:MAG: SRPBCC domain-containing protein [Bacteroidales bacterium]|nr:SRPBCC domain-containing protein [Bacteroidales bacterium]